MISGASRQVSTRIRRQCNLVAGCAATESPRLSERVKRITILSHDARFPGPPWATRQLELGWSPVEEPTPGRVGVAWRGTVIADDWVRGAAGEGMDLQKHA
jgi:hypothetical protein